MKITKASTQVSAISCNNCGREIEGINYDYIASCDECGAQILADGNIICIEDEGEDDEGFALDRCHGHVCSQECQDKWIAKNKENFN